MTKREISLGLGIPLSLNLGESPSDSMALITISDGESEKSVLVSHRGVRHIDADRYLEAPKERLRPKHAVKRDIAAAAMQGAGWFLAAVLLTFVSLTATGLMKAQVILTSSMSPTINPGDIVLELSPDRIKPQVGSIATYVGKRMDGSVVATFTHRIVGIDEKGNYIFKGDANKDADVQHPTIDEIEGVKFLLIPKVGSLLSPRMIMMLLLAGFGIWLIVDAFRRED